MEDGGRSRKDGESRSPKVVKKPEVESPKSEVEENNSAPDSYPDDIPQSEIHESELNKSEIVNRKSEMEIHQHAAETTI